MEQFTFSSCAYCWKNEPTWDELLHFKCDVCCKRVHYGCIKSSPPSPLLDDTFFLFKCEACSDDGREDFTRMKMSWQDTVALSLYHLQKTNQGRCGYFHWRLQICAFIDKNWRCLFGLHRKKTTLWLGTVGGTLSSGCPDLFASGAKQVEMGYWRLTNLAPPLPQAEKKRSGPKKKAVSEQPVYLNPEERRTRTPKDNALAAAMELKEKKVASVTAKTRRKKEAKLVSPTPKAVAASRKAGGKGKGKRSKADAEPPVEAEEDRVAELSALLDSGRVYVSDAEDAASVASSVTLESSISSSVVSHSQDEQGNSSSNTRLDFLNAIKLEAEDDEGDFDIDIGTVTALDMPDCRPESPDMTSVLECMGDNGSQNVSGKSPVAQHRTTARDMGSDIQNQDHASLDTGPEEDSDRDMEESEDSTEGDESEDKSDDEEEEEGSEASEKVSQSGLADEVPKRKRGRPRKRRRIDDAPPTSPPPRLDRISVFEERELLQKLNEVAGHQTLRPDLAQLRRKLICNQTNREFGLPVFDLDSQMEKISSPQNTGNFYSFQENAFLTKTSIKATNVKETRDLDRFMMHAREATSKSRTYTTFKQRLVGLEDHELKPTVSPYTTRVLLPFIWRNYSPSKKPVKLKLLQEVQAYPHRNDASWEAPPSPPIDFCYVRPEHIPSVNALCREFFWPGIDMSECLQYPDFSCVVLYRKIVIAFAFMVPDRGYNEAYISFIFTHPEWRGAGIATFMLYHLIQTCMGKDVLLHVSATNPAMLLYQKFGFKAQELILNFYYKYFPFDSKDSTHAFLMRLTR